MTIKNTYSAREAMRLCGYETIAMIDYLQRSGVFLNRRRRSSGRGSRRRFVFRDLVILKAIKRLLDAGVSVAILKRSLNEFQELTWSADPVTLEDANGVIRFLVVSGNSVYLRKDANVLVDLSQQGQLAFSFIIDLEKIHGELRDDIGLPKLQTELELAGGDYLK